MRSERALRACMQALVFLNLVFVQLTGIAGLHWLVPLYALTLAAPLLARQRERMTYRLLWNAGVVCFFLVLLRHALRAELASVLEDGLVMAVLCQVHLLNNLRSSQRPDLLFFNAFLIAIITGFMNRGLGFPLACLAFAPCFVIGLQLLAATRGGHALSRLATRRLVLDGARRTAVLLGASLLVFLFWPRDFERKAYLHGRLDEVLSGTGQLELGFNEALDLNRRGSVADADKQALRVTVISGDGAGVPALWRGATLAVTSGDAWHPMQPAIRRLAGAVDEGWSGEHGQLTRSASRASPGAAKVRVEVIRFAQQTERLFTPLRARVLRLAPEQAALRLRPRLDATIDVAETGEVRYELTLAPPALRPGGRRTQELSVRFAPYVVLPDDDRIARARELAAELAARLPAESEQHELVAIVSEHLSRNYAYLAPGTPGAPTTLDQFLSGEAGGHCEFFASALATMLRSLEIPCRVVTGFRSTRWDSAGRVLAFGTSNAHAWVEVYDPRAGWYAVDPSPALAATDGSTSLWARLRSRARSAWQSVTGFDAERRAAFFVWVGGLPERIGGQVRQRPLAASTALLLLVLAAGLTVRRRLARTQPAVRALRRARRRAGLRPLPGETPRELVSRARGRGLSPERVKALEAATQQHEALRYAA